MPSNPEQQDLVTSAMLGMQRRSWEQGVAGHALLDLGASPLVCVMARDAAGNQTLGGKLAEPAGGEGIVNCAANGEAVLWAAGSTGDVRLRDAFDRQVAWLTDTAPRAADGTLFHLEASRQVWVDTVYMVVPLLVLAGRHEAAWAQLEGHRARLFDPGTRLYGHQWDEDQGRLIRPQAWGSGNGWVVAGIARALRHAGPRRRDDERCRRAAAHAVEVIDACLALRAPSGLFHDVVDDPASFEETTLAQMLAYGIFTGITDGWLGAAYADAGHSLVRTARAQVDQDGLVFPACGAPRFDRPGTSVEAQAFYLLAAAAEAGLP